MAKSYVPQSYGMVMIHILPPQNHWLLKKIATKCLQANMTVN